MENQEQGTPNPEQVNQQFNQQFAQSFGQPQLPNSTAVLVLGIVSIVGCSCYGIVGLITGIIALVLAGKANALLRQNPGKYSEASLKNLKAGRVCAIIGTSLSAVFLIVFIIELIFLGSIFSSLPWGDILNKH